MASLVYTADPHKQFTCSHKIIAPMVKCEMQESLILCCCGSKCILITAVKLWINQFVKSFPRQNPFDSLHIMHGLDTADTMAMWDYHLFYSIFLWLSRPSRWCSFLSESEYDDDDDDMSKNFPQISKKHLIFVDVS